MLKLCSAASSLLLLGLVAAGCGYETGPAGQPSTGVGRGFGTAGGESMPPPAAGSGRASTPSLPAGQVGTAGSQATPAAMGGSGLQTQLPMGGGTSGNPAGLPTFARPPSQY